ncbi:hypothetical protein MVEG_08608 [Podila verticillata NRRL 6337]|nr:hypothetical protein MVEG_08608 [Podila verticillata NRRL 6337]
MLYYIGCFQQEIDAFELQGADFNRWQTRLQDIKDFQQQMQPVDYDYAYLNLCTFVLQNRHREAKMFAVLPSDLDSWKDSDPKTHCFRLYHVCQKTISGTYNGEPVVFELHFSNHSGYNLKHPQEFFQRYGGYVLAVLRLIKYGHYFQFNGQTINYVSPLDPQKLLHIYESVNSGRRVADDNIGSLIDKAITYLQRLLPPFFWILKMHLNEAAHKDIVKYLDIQDGDNGLGCLYREAVTMLWTCSMHPGGEQLRNSHISNLIEYVMDRGGAIDIPRAELKIKLLSRTESERFCTLLQGAGRRFVMSIKLEWEVSNWDLEEFIRGVKDQESLSLDGVTLGSLAKSHIDFEVDRRADPILRANLPLFILVNYPRPKEQVMYVKNRGDGIGLHSRVVQRSEANWIQMNREMSELCEPAFGEKQWTCTDLVALSKRLKVLLLSYGHPLVNDITMHSHSWHGRFDLNKSTFVDAQLLDALFPKTLIAAGSLRLLTLNFLEQGFDISELADFLYGNPQLEKINIMVRETDGLSQIDNFMKSRENLSSTHYLTLLECTKDSTGREVVGIVFHGPSSECLSSATLNHKAARQLNTARQPREHLWPSEFEVLKWVYDHVSSPLSDISASIIDVASNQHSSVLCFFTLNVSPLTSKGLFSVREILRRSRLAHLRIESMRFDPNLEGDIRQVLGAVQWPPLKSLVLTGDNIDEWLQLWAAIEDQHAEDHTSLFSLQLRHLEIRATGKAQQSLSHTSVLFLHQVIYSDPSVEFCLENMQFQEKYDSALITDALAM